MGSNKDHGNNGEMSFLEHLEVLRWHIVRSIIYVIVFAIVAFLLKEIIFDKIFLALKSPEFITYRIICAIGEKINIPDLCIKSLPFNIINISMYGQFAIHIEISVISGLIFASPFIIFEFWNFVKPALYKHERKYAKMSVFYISLLFFFGILFGYYIIVPFCVQFFSTYILSNEVANQINLRSYISMINSVLLGCGIVFEFPVFIYFLSRVGIITPQFLRRMRKYSLVIILIIAAIITPPDILSQILVSIPLIGLYELSIVISKRVERKSVG